MSMLCPQCHGEATIQGKIYNQIDYVNPPAYFRPNGLPIFAIFRSSVQMENSFFACSFCGFMWSKIDNQQLQQFSSSKRTV